MAELSSVIIDYPDTEANVTELAERLALASSNDRSRLIDHISARVVWDENKYYWPDTWKSVLAKVPAFLMGEIKERLMHLVSETRFPESEGAASLLFVTLDHLSSKEQTKALFELVEKVPDEYLRLSVFNYLLGRADKELMPKVFDTMTSDSSSNIRSIGFEEKAISYYKWRTLFKGIANGSTEKEERVIDLFSSDRVSTSLCVKLASIFIDFYLSKKDGSGERANLAAFFLRILEKVWREKDKARYRKFIESILASDYTIQVLARDLDFRLTDGLRAFAVSDIQSASGKMVPLIKRARESLLNLKAIPFDKVAMAARGIFSLYGSSNAQDFISLIETTKESNITFDVFEWHPSPDMNIAQCKALLRGMRPASDRLDVIEFAEKFGIKCVEFDAPDGFYGILVKAADLPFPVIVYNGNHYSSQQRFTIAHELSHFFLPQHNNAIFRCKVNELVDVEDNRDPYGRFEQEANSFGAWLLMPDDKVLERVTGGLKGWAHIKEIQRDFDVSLIAIARKIVDLSPMPVALLRLTDGRIDYRLALKDGGFPYWALPAIGRQSPRNSGVRRLTDEVTEVATQMPLYSWCDSEKIKENEVTLSVNEYVAKYGDDGALVFLEILNNRNINDGYDEIDQEEIDHYENQNRHKKGFSFYDRSKSR